MDARLDADTRLDARTSDRIELKVLHSSLSLSLSLPVDGGDSSLVWGGTCVAGWDVDIAKTAASPSR